MSEVKIEFDTRFPLEGDCPRFHFPEPGIFEIKVSHKDPITGQTKYHKVNHKTLGNEILPASKYGIGANYFTICEVSVTQLNSGSRTEVGCALRSFNSLEDATVCIKMDSKSLGDTLAAMPAIIQFYNRLPSSSKLIVSTFFNYLFEDNYKDIIFVGPNTYIRNVQTTIFLGNTDLPNTKLTKISYLNHNLQEVFADTLGITTDFSRPFVSIVPIQIPEEKYVVISDNASGSLKEFKGNWQKVIFFLQSKGYKVAIIGENKSFLRVDYNYQGKMDLRQTAYLLQNADFFIGVSSGLSWLAWAVNCPVIMISDFTPHYHEFSDGIIRLGGEGITEIKYIEPLKRVKTSEVLVAISQMIDITKKNEKVS